MGLLVCLEGIDNAGKTTQAEILGKRFRKNGLSVSRFRSPDDTLPTGELIRRVLDGKVPLDIAALMALFTANRLEQREAIENQYKDDGALLLCDRYSPSELAYGSAFGLPVEWLRNLESLCRPPDLIFLLDISIETGALRANEPPDTFEQRTEVLRTVRQNYLDQAVTSDIWHTVDASQSISAIADTIESIVMMEVGRRTRIQV